MKIKVNPKELDRLKILLAQKLAAGCDRAVEAAKDVSRIDTGRLQSSIRHDEPEIGDRSIQCNILIGGTIELGVFYEQGIEKPVDYGLEVEVRTPVFRQNLESIGESIAQGLAE